MNRTVFGLFASAIVLAGCGGTGGAPSIPPVAETPAEKGTALFNVDVTSGKVKVVPLETGTKTSAVLGGNAVTFETATLLSEGGEVGRRAVKVRLRNNLSEAIGVGRPIRIQFGVVGPLSNYPTDLRDQATVSSLIADPSPGFQDGPVASAHISNPSGVAVGADGAVYFTGSDNRVRRLLDGYVSTVAQNVPATGLAYLKDSISGREFLVASCAGVHSVKLVPIASGSVSTWAGLDNTSGNVNGAPGAARFNSPQGIAIDAGTSQVLVADTNNGAVRAIPFTFNGGNLVAGNVLTRYSGLTNPYYVAVSSNRTVGVTEASANRVRLFNAGSSREAIIGTGGSGNVVGDGNTSQFALPTGITALGDTFFVSDALNNQIKRIALKNGAAPLLAANWRTSLVAGTGTAGTADGSGTVAQFLGGNQLVTDAQGRLVLADLSGNSIRRVVSNGSFDFGTPDGSGTGQAALANPTGFVDLNGLQRPYIDLIQRIEPGQTVDAGDWQFVIPPGINAFQFAVTVEAGTNIYAPLEAVLNPTGGPGSPNVVAQFLSRDTQGSALTGQIGSVSFDLNAGILAYDAAGNAFVTDYSFGTIRRIAVDGSVTYVAGKLFSSSEVDGTGVSARFSAPSGIVTNRQGTELFVADFGGKTIRRIALAFEGADPTLASNWVVTTVAGLAATSGDANGAGNVARFQGPFSLAGPNNDSIYIGETVGSRIRLLRYTGGDRSLATSWDVILVAGSSSGIPGDVNGVGSNARFGNVSGLAYSESGNVFIADLVNRKIRMLDTRTFAVTTVAGSTIGNVDSDNALSAQLQGPSAVATDAAGAVYFFDVNRIKRLLNGGVRTVAGGGDGSGTSGDKVLFGDCYSLALTPQGDLTFSTNKRLVRLTRKLGR